MFLKFLIIDLNKKKNTRVDNAYEIITAVAWAHCHPSELVDVSFYWKRGAERAVQPKNKLSITCYSFAGHILGTGDSWWHTRADFHLPVTLNRHIARSSYVCYSCSVS